MDVPSSQLARLSHFRPARVPGLNVYAGRDFRDSMRAIPAAPM